MGADAEQAAVGGGVADKWGNRYEAWWTVLSGVLPVLRGEFGAIWLEPPDREGEGAEFKLYDRRPSGPDEVHQCKRYRDTSWTVRALETGKVLAPLGRHLSEGLHAVFVSGMPSILRGMTTKAVLPLDKWSNSLNDKEEPAKAELIKAWGVSEAEVHRRLGHLTIRTVDDHTLRGFVVEAIAGLIEGDPEEALLRLGDFLLDHLMLRVTADQLWGFLRRGGFTPRAGRDLALSERVRDLTSRYVRSVEGSRPPNLALIDRPEVDSIVQTLTGPDAPRTVVVTGRPGSGKSTAVAEVCRRLTELGFVVGPLRLDMAAEAWTAEGLGGQANIGFGDSPARVLARAAASGRAVLVVDQLDALSALSGRGETVVDGVREMLEQACATKGLRILIACRSHDLAHDRQLRQLLRGRGMLHSEEAEPGQPFEIAIGNLTEKQVREVLRDMGFAPAALPQRSIRLLTNTFNLSLLAKIAQDAQVEDDTVDLRMFHAQQDLLTEYHRHRARRMRRTLGSDGYASAVFRLARDISASGRLSLSQDEVEDIPDTIEALVHEGVIALEEGRVRFFHEAYFDYIFALQHIQVGKSATDLIRDDPQDLLRRGQVRAILTLERQRGTPIYLADLKGVLEQEEVRSHIRSAVLAWLKDQTAADDDELKIVIGLAVSETDPLKIQAVRTLCSNPFASRLGQHGLMTAAADVLGGRATTSGGFAELLHRFDDQSCAYLLFESARSVPEVAAAACLPLAGDPSSAIRLINVLLRTVFLAGPTAGPITANLFRTTTATIIDYASASPRGGADESDAPAATPDSTTAEPTIDVAVGILYGVGGRHALSTLVKHAPSHAAAAIEGWLAGASKIVYADGGRSLLSDMLHRQSTGLEIFERSASAAPEGFLRAVLPFMLQQYESESLLQRRRPARSTESGDGLRNDLIQGFGSGFPSLGNEIYDALRLALGLVAVEHPSFAISFIRQLTGTDLLSAHQLAASAFGTCSPELADEALRWAKDSRVRGLATGYTVGWAWGEVVAHLAATGSEAQRSEAMRLALEGYEDLDLESIGDIDDPPDPTDEQGLDSRRAAAEQLVALTLITRRLGDLTPPEIREQRARLEARLGPVPNEPVSDPADLEPRRLISDEAAQDFTNDDWRRVIHDEAGPDHVAEIASQLERLAKAQPARFAAFVVELGSTVDPTYVVAILRGITAVAATLPDGGIQKVVRAVQSLSSERDPVSSEISSLIAALAQRDLPQSIVEIAARLATTRRTAAGPTAGDNLQDTATDNINGRDWAVRALASLLAPAATRGARARTLLPTVRLLVDDPDERIRMLLPPVLVRLFLAETEAATELASRWMGQASDAALGASELDRLVWQILPSRPQEGERLIERMIQSPESEVRTRGGAMAALQSLRWESYVRSGTGRQSLLSDALRDPAARKGVAIMLAQLADEIPPDRGVEGGPQSARANRQLLIELLDDDDEAVRESAAGYALSLSPPLDRHAALLAATARSRAFAERPEPVLLALSKAPGNLAEEALDVCEVWLEKNSTNAGDIQTRAAADAYYVVEIVLAIHARSPMGSTERARCLSLVDRLIEAGAADADKKIDDGDFH